MSFSTHWIESVMLSARRQSEVIIPSGPKLLIEESGWIAATALASATKLTEWIAQGDQSGPTVKIACNHRRLTVLNASSVSTDLTAQTEVLDLIELIDPIGGDAGIREATLTKPLFPAIEPR